MNYFPMLPLIGVISNLSLAIFILYLNPKDRSGRMFSYFSLSIALWSLGDYLTNSAETIEIAERMNHISTIAASLMAVFLLIYILRFTKNKIVSSYLFYVIFILPLAFLLLGIFTKLLIKDFIIAPWGYALVPGPLYNLFSIVVSSLVILSLILCFKYSKTALTQSETKQAKVMLIALLIPTIGGLGTQVLPPLIGHSALPLTTTLTTIMSIIIAIAIIKYRMMDVTPDNAADQIVSTIPDYLFILDQDLTITFVNNAFEEFLKQKKEELVERNIGDTLPELAKDLYSRKEKNKKFETSITRGKLKIPFSVVLTRIMDTKRKNQVTGYLVMLRDITHQKALVHSLELSKAELFRAREELTQSKIALEEKIKQYSTFTKIAPERQVRLLELKIRLSKLKPATSTN